MKLGEIVRMVVGGFVVYAVLATCGDGDGTSRRPGVRRDATDDALADAGRVEVGGGDASVGPDATADRESPEDPTFVETAESALDAVLDALQDPVPEAAAEEWTVPGSRLRPRLLTAADGARQFYQWWDSQRAEPCLFQTAGDGVMRCLPLAQLSVSPSYFLDAECTQRLAMVSKVSCSTADPFSAAASYELGCPTRVRVFEVGAKLGAVTVYSGSPETTCTKNDYMTDTGPTQYDFYAVGAELPPSSFVKGELSVVP